MEARATRSDVQIFVRHVHIPRTDISFNKKIFKAVKKVSYFWLTLNIFYLGKFDVMCI
jgi:hypothetical protein